MEKEPQQPMRLIVVDANALIKGLDLTTLNADCYTIPDVIAEVRDKQSQEALLRRKDQLKTRIPNEEAFQKVVAFSKKTGDFATLSVTDLKVLALAYMLEKEQNGVEHVRLEPLKPMQGVVKPQRKQPLKEKVESAPIESHKKLTPLKPAQAEKQAGPGESSLVEKQIASIKLSEEESVPAQFPPKEQKDDSVIKAQDPEDEGAEEATLIDDDGEASDDSEGEWITPANIAKHKAKNNNSTKFIPADDPCKVFVGCLTSDFAMQNVLLQMNLKLVSKEGEIIRETKTWALRCHACFKITTDLSKQFCPSCGNSTLMRASVSVDSNGNMVCYLKRNFQYNIRGTKYSLPTPEGGRKANNLIIREDQKEYEKAVKTHNHHMKKTASDMQFDSDFEAIFKQSAGSRSTPGIQIGHGRRNPNNTRGRRR
ncbi:Nin1 binding protein [Dinochytrium kinnereticum]|nr:Nin1 binding protein [Dinochytrium kinnereticum]